MKTKINSTLQTLANEKDIEILFAVESGSRAWGFASPDSDYDIRFVYKHKTNWYLNLWEQKDTIEFMTKEDFDGSGWDIKKACKLMTKSNIAILDWLFSPIVYQENDVFMSEIKSIAIEQFNPIAGFYHYHNMSKRFDTTLKEENMTLKNFFYAIRSTLCALWIYKNESIPPVKFIDLLDLVPLNYHSEIKALIETKRNTNETDLSIVSVVLIHLVKGLIEKNECIKDLLTHRKANPELFNSLFIKTIL